MTIDIVLTDEYLHKAKYGDTDGIQNLGHVCEMQLLINYLSTYNQAGYEGQEGIGCHRISYSNSCY